MGCGIPPGSFDFGPSKPGIWHMEVSVNIKIEDPYSHVDESSCGLSQLGYMYFRAIVDFVFSVRLGQHVDTARTIKYEANGHSIENAIQNAFEHVLIKHGYPYDTENYRERFGPRCPVHFSKLPVFLSIDHLPEMFQEMVKQIITGQHFKFIGS